ncbi:hypothetical protein, partial [Rhizobium paknamense]|uniref:hypothetical protein n=1 Tax=Rhizobium paknamense TaxID=1206817 RepID=UPI0027D7D1A3
CHAKAHRPRKRTAEKKQEMGPEDHLIITDTLRSCFNACRYRKTAAHFYATYCNALFLQHNLDHPRFTPVGLCSN